MEIELDMAKNMVRRNQELQWQAEEDARTLVRYQEIMNDTKRRSAAIKQARIEATDLQKRAEMMKKAGSRSK